MSTRPGVVIILAAGEGKRMKSAVPKVLHPIAGRSLVGHVIEAAAHLEPEHVVVVVGHGREHVVEHLAEIAPWVVPVVQDEQRGTGHAVRIALDDLASRGVRADGPIVVLTGDTPLVNGGTLDGLMSAHSGACTVLTATVTSPTGYGRIVRNGNAVAAIVEERDASDEQRLINEINAGMYVFESSALVERIARLDTDNAQSEEYLTDVVSMITADGLVVNAHVSPDSDDIRGVNDRVQLAEAAAIMRDRINESWMRAGVSIADPASTWIDVDVEIEPDAQLLPQTILRGPTAIAARARVGPGTTLVSCEVGADSEVIHTWAELAVIGDNARVGPFTYLRPGANLGAGAKAGAYVEIKNSSVGDGAKVAHLSYVGDADIGEDSNIGAATRHQRDLPGRRTTVTVRLTRFSQMIPPGRNEWPKSPYPHKSVSCFSAADRTPNSPSPSPTNSASLCLRRWPTTSPMVRSSFVSGSLFVGRTRSSCKATPRRSTRGSWSN